jgi:type IV pilus assembly protein PilM
VNIDYQVIDHVDDNRQMEVLLVAAKKDIVSSYGSASRRRVVPIIVDVYCARHMYELNYDPTPDQVVALVNIGARYSSMNILKGGRSTFTGDVPVGGRDITEALTRDLGVTADVAERLKTGREVDGVSADQVSMALGPATDALIEEIHYALSFFWTAATDERIDALYISGGAAGIPELRQRLADRAEAPVEVADPLARVGFAPGIDVAAVRARGSELAVAMGLAIRRPEDK